MKGHATREGVRLFGVVVVLVVIGSLILETQASCSTPYQCCPCICCNERKGSACLVSATQTYCAKSSDNCGQICYSHQGGGGGSCGLGYGGAYQANECSQCVDPLHIQAKNETLDLHLDYNKSPKKENEQKPFDIKPLPPVKTPINEKEETKPTSSPNTTPTIPTKTNATVQESPCPNSYCCTCTCCTEAYNGNCVSGAEAPFTVCVTGDSSDVCYDTCLSMIGGAGLGCSPPALNPPAEPDCSICK